MFSAIFDIIKFILFTVLIIASPLICFAIYFFIHTSIRILININFKKMSLPKRGSYKEPSFFKRLFVMFPKQYVIDLFNRKDFEFDPVGVHCVVGAQGKGKTITVVHMLRKWQKLYPYMQSMSNMDYKHQTYELNHWRDLVDKNNEHFGMSVVIDEIQTWFSSLQSKDFPPEMLNEVSQQRKQRKAIIGTAQVFSRIAKPIREQTHYIYVPFTILGCLTIVRKTHENYWDDKEQKFKKYTGMYFFVHDEELRNAFDTLKKIEKYSSEGFKADSDRLTIYETSNLITFKSK